jgi:hypothetical protein
MQQFFRLYIEFFLDFPGISQAFSEVVFRILLKILQQLFRPLFSFSYDKSFSFQPFKKWSQRSAVQKQLFSDMAYRKSVTIPIIPSSQGIEDR